LVKNKGLSNVYFIDPIPKVEIQAMLNRFDACYIGWLDEKLYRFGIGANKIPEYLCSGRPIIHSYSGSCDPIGALKAGICIPAEDVEQLVDAIHLLYQMSVEERNLIGNNGYLAAMEQYEYSRLAYGLAEVLFFD
jgi:glycosyltransferase involved in cell wall biosynthesis